MEKRESVTSDTGQESRSLYGAIGWGVPQTLSRTTMPTNSRRILGDAWQTLDHALNHGDESSKVMAEVVIYVLLHDEVMNGLFHPQTGVMCKFADQADRTIEKAVACLETGLR